MFASWDEPPLPERVRALPLDELRDYALARVAPAGREVWDEAALGLQAARRLVERGEKAGLTGPQLAPSVYVLGLALAANGQAAAAMAAAERATELSGPTPESAAWKTTIAEQCEVLDGKPLGLELRVLEQQVAALERDQHGNGGWRFEDSADQFLHDTLRAYELALDEFCDPKDGWLSRMRWRLKWARELARGLTRDHPNARVSWDEASEAIRRQMSIELEPQWGLVPIGMNPQTKLWEFYHLRSAWDPRSGAEPSSIRIPAHDAAGNISVDKNTGIVFVLVAGGSCWVGADELRGPHRDPGALDNEMPQERTLGPFFIARHELTQAQWMRLSLGDNPCQFKSGFTAAKMPTTVTLTHPVESVDWSTSTALLRTHGLLLPTEAQWEYAARAGTTTPWHTGDDPAGLEGFENLCDLTMKGVYPGTRVSLEWSDGHVVHSPVGSFRPNPFGLFDVHGNVGEWCRDPGGYQRDPVDGPAALRLSIRLGAAYPLTHRGGSFRTMTRDARSAARHQVNPEVRREDLGVRVVRMIDP